MKIEKICAVLIMMTLLPTKCYAYIDPGTGGLILTNFWSLIAGIFGAILGLIAVKFIAPLKKFIKKILKGHEKK
ncbi:MAG: hypothetical protein ABIJ34_07520 [archaeon]